MFSIYKKNHNELYNTLVTLSRNIFFYKKINLKDDFETRILLIFLHFSMILIANKNNDSKKFSQEIFDNVFLNIEYHIRELGYGDVAVNKKMKDLNKIFYDILLKINTSTKKTYNTNTKLLKKYFSDSSLKNIDKFNYFLEYLTDFYNYCFALTQKNMINELKKYNYKNGST